MYRRVAQPGVEQHNVLPHRAPASEAATTAVPHLHNRCRAPGNEAHRANSWRHIAGVSLSLTRWQPWRLFFFFFVREGKRTSEREITRRITSRSLLRIGRAFMTENTGYVVGCSLKTPSQDEEGHLGAESPPSYQRAWPMPSEVSAVLCSETEPRRVIPARRVGGGGGVCLRGVTV